MTGFYDINLETPLTMATLMFTSNLNYTLSSVEHQKVL